MGVTCIDRRQTTADRREVERGTGETKWNETKRESAALKLQYILPQFCCCCFFISCAIERRKDHLKNSGFVVFHSCCTPSPSSPRSLPYLGSYFAHLYFVGHWSDNEKDRKNTQIKCSKRSKQKCQMSTRRNQINKK